MEHRRALAGYCSACRPDNFSVASSKRRASGQKPAGQCRAPFGGKEGNNVTHDHCPGNEVMVGVRYRAGAWIDQLSVACAPVGADGRLGAPHFLAPRGGGGGTRPTDALCPPTPGAISGIAFVLTDKDREVGRITLSCMQKLGSTPLEVGPASSGSSVRVQRCPAGQVAVGLGMRTGDAVNKLELMCGPLGAGSPTPVANTRDGCAGLSGELLNVCTEHNVERAKHGVPHLTWDPTLAANAAAWVKRLPHAKGRPRERKLLSPA